MPEPIYISFGFVTIQGVEYEMLIPRPSYGPLEIGQIVDSIKLRDTKTGKFKDFTYGDKTVKRVNPETGEMETVIEKGKVFSKEEKLQVILEAWNSQAEPDEPIQGKADLQRAITYGVIEDQLRMQGVDENLFFLPDVENFLSEISAYQRSITPAFIEGLVLQFGDIMKDPGRAGEILKGLLPGAGVEQQGTADYYYPLPAGATFPPQINWDKFYGVGPYEGQPAAAYGGKTRYPEGATEDEKAAIDVGTLPAGFTRAEMGAYRRSPTEGMTREQVVEYEGLHPEAGEERHRQSAVGQRRLYLASPAGRAETESAAQFAELVRRSRRPQRVTRL